MNASPVIALVAALLFAGQQAPTRDTPGRRMFGTAVLAGTVINELTGQPIRRVSLSLSNAELGLRLTAVSDDKGQFAFKDLPDGRYLLSGTKPGFVPMSYGATKTQRPGTAIPLAPGERRTGVTVKLPPGAVLTGAVRNRSGDPVADARVSVLRNSVSYTTGEPTLQPVNFGFGELTDDRGEYRIHSLPAGDYYIVVAIGIGPRNESELREITTSEVDWATRLLKDPGATPQPPQSGRAVEYSPVFYPGSASQGGASTVTVKAGEERSGVDVMIDMTPTAKINGTVVSPEGNLPGGLQVNVIAHDTIPGIPFSGFGSARVDASGKFVSAGLSPGTYTLTVRATAGRGGGPAPAALFGLAVVTLNGVDTDTTITLNDGATVSGRLVFTGAAKPPADLTRIRISLNAAPGRTPTLGVNGVSPDATGAFKFVGVAPGKYRLSAANIGAWFTRSATIQGHDILDQALEVQTQDIDGAEIAFTDSPAEISGDLLDASGKPAPEYTIIVFPDDRALWQAQSRRISGTRPGGDGHFKFANLPPGDYRIAAVTDVEPNEWFDPSYLEKLVAASTKLTLGEGEKKVQGLRIKGS